MNVVFFGTPAFSVPVLRALHQAGHAVVAVVTQPDKPQKRSKQPQPSAAKQAALALEIPVLQFAKIKAPEGVQALSGLNADIWVTAAYGQILSKELLQIPPLGVVNAHASLLPKYRGPAPVNWCLIEGETITGVTTMYTDVGIDNGDIILARNEPILPEDTAATLLERLSCLAGDLMVETLSRIQAGTAPRIPQDEALSTRHPMLSKHDGALDFTQPAQRLLQRTNGVTPWPGAYASYEGTVYKFENPYLMAKSGPPGLILSATPKEGLLIACGEGAIGFGRIQAPGKKMMDTGVFLRGHAFDLNKRFSH